jgi:hypothetical protein
MTTAALSNPFALMMDPERITQAIAKSESLRRLSQRECRPLDKPVIRSKSAEIAAFDSKIDRHTVYLAPGEETPAVLPRRGSTH